jgi:hypothetical protein
MNPGLIFLRRIEQDLIVTVRVKAVLAGSADHHAKLGCAEDGWAMFPA